MLAKTLVLAASRIEASPIIDKLRGVRKEKSARISIYSGLYAETPLSVVVFGMGKACALRLVEFLRGSSTERFISLGVSGALNPELQVGDIVIASAVTSMETDERIGLKGANEIAAVLGCRVVSSLTAPRVIVSAAEKQRLAGAFTCDCVDMETHYLMAAMAGIPSLSLRCISDSATGELPKALSGVGSSASKVNQMAAFAKLAAAGQLKTLLELKQTVEAGAIKLEAALQTVLEEKILTPAC